MITKPTVLILGAGASQPYNFPLGEGLFWEVINNALGRAGAETLVKMGFSKEEIDKFKKDLFGSGTVSVDVFLEHRKELIDIGKAAIALILVRREKVHTLYDSGEGKWYKYFYYKLSASFEEFGNNEVSVITYNYDRSLEHFLFNSLKKMYNKPDGACAEQLKKIPIIHLHGRLGYLPWQDLSGRDYFPHNNEPDILKESAKDIKIISEDIDVDTEPDFVKARKLLKKAERVYILGFGYNRTNIERLKIDEWGGIDKVTGSTKGFVANELQEINKYCHDKIYLMGLDTSEGIDYDVLEFLKNCAQWD